tara:strand:- start:485 stop:595 length:111 start_codon:yes stop_codon:yes gene_type:complete
MSLQELPLVAFHLPEKNTIPFQSISIAIRAKKTTAS